MHLLDTNIVSELRRPRPHGGVLAWLQSRQDMDLHLSAVTLGEFQAGVELTRDQDAAKAAEIETWLNLVSQSDNVLPKDGSTFRTWARLRLRRSDRRYESAMTVATATVHRLTVATRNVADFAKFDVKVLNPFAPRRPDTSWDAQPQNACARVTTYTWRATFSSTGGATKSCIGFSTPDEREPGQSRESMPALAPPAVRLPSSFGR